MWHGDVADSAKRKFVREPTQILMTTPESLEVMLVSPRSPAQRLFKDLRVVVIDEVHALAGTDRGAHLMSVIERLAPSSTNDIQRVGLSATVGNPDQILAWLKGSSRRDGVVVDPPKTSSKRDLFVSLHESVAGLAGEAAKGSTNADPRHDGRGSIWLAAFHAVNWPTDGVKRAVMLTRNGPIVVTNTSEPMVLLDSERGPVHDPGQQWLEDHRAAVAGAAPGVYIRALTDEELNQEKVVQATLEVGYGLMDIVDVLPLVKEAIQGSGNPLDWLAYARLARWGATPEECRGAAGEALKLDPLLDEATYLLHHCGVTLH